MTLRKVFSIACWTFAGFVFGIIVATLVLSISDGKPAALMCGNSILEPGLVYGGFLGFLGGCVIQASWRNRSAAK